ncbi:hypothetical protein LEN26_002004 [Aphanomyces euteiches]|nr:hypothetical protein AeMF1_013027 [Aphanomyces euteiches]KAH9160136.1 hypothetical protein LEN26_002004 [Aphanomyces euteiches]KAH9182276.1 hypothetical protein AeNC1_015748 [Aphanomyces euteiches]
MVAPSFETFFADLTVLRRQIHEHPELGLEEVKTQALVRDYLINVAKIPEEQIHVSGITGLAVDIFGPTDGPKPANAPLTCLAFRGDMDALPMTERNPHLPYESKVAGAAHMCGHDGHTANLMGFAALVQQRRHLLPQHSTIRLLFQPGEEGFFGAEKMIKDGCLEGVDEVYGYHVGPFPLGKIYVKSGPIMAHCAFFDVKITGPGGHGSAPHMTKDPIVAAGQLITAFQTITSRNLAPHDNAIVSVCQVHGGEANNVIPSSVTLAGTIRDFSPASADIIRQRMKTLVEHTCAAYDLKGELEVQELYPVTVNPVAETTIFESIAASIVGEANVSDEGLPLCGAEDFSYFLQERPGCFFFIGSRAENDKQNRMNHSDTFDFNDEILPLGARFFLEIVQHRLQCALYTAEELQQMTADVLKRSI